MKMRSLLAAVVGVGLVAVTTSPPSGNRYFYQSSPPNPLLIQMVGRSHISLIADLFWIRAIGVSTSLKVPADGRVLIAWCGLVTELDPHFVWPYIFGGLLGPMPGATTATWYNVREGNALLSRGMAHIPGDFRLPLYLSYNQLQLDHDTGAAAETLRRGALEPKAPIYLAQLATRLLAQTDAFEAAHAFASQLEEKLDRPHGARLLRAPADGDRTRPDALHPAAGRGRLPPGAGAAAHLPDAAALGGLREGAPH